MNWSMGIWTRHMTCAARLHAQCSKFTASYSAQREPRPPTSQCTLLHYRAKSRDYYTHAKEPAHGIEHTSQRSLNPKCVEDSHSTGTITLTIIAKKQFKIHLQKPCDTSYISQSRRTVGQVLNLCRASIGEG